MEEIKIDPIGIINTPFKTRDGMPIQPSGADGVEGIIKIQDKYKEGLKDLDGFSHIILIYQFHLVKDYELSLIPFMDSIPHGVFSTRAPKRPNAIGFSVVKLNKVEDNLVYIENIDVLDETPLIDIKPLIPDVDFADVTKLGWLEGRSNKMGDKTSDKRFL